MTPREAAAVLAGAVERAWRETRRMQRLAYSQAVLSTFAFHKPGKMPAFEKAFPDGKPKQPQSPDEIMRAMEQWTVALAARYGD